MLIHLLTMFEDEKLYYVVYDVPVTVLVRNCEVQSLLRFRSKCGAVSDAMCTTHMREIFANRK